MTISQQSSSGGISEMYAKYGRELTHAQDANARTDVLKRFRTALVSRVPDPDVFDSGFSDRLVLTDELTREKKLVRYVLGRLHEYTHPGTRIDAPTVEHLLPQEMRNLQPDIVGNIGNLVWLPEDLNRKLDNKTFEQKKAILEPHRNAFDINDILDSESWGAREIKRRAHRLAKLARNEVWGLPVKASG